MRTRTVAIGALAALLCASGSVSAAAPDAGGWAAVPPADLSRLKLSDFADDEIELPYYVAHFHEVANRVVESGEDRGFIDVHVWRNLKDNRPYNARIMESVLSLAYFYATKRPWNPHYASPALRVRLEAALSFWCGKQHVDGRFPEYGPGEWNLAATAFTTKFMGETLTLLRDGPPIDDAVLQRAIAADRKAIEAVLDLPELYEHGKDFSNQYTNVYAGGLAYLRLYPDSGLAERLARSMRDNTHVFQSPAGYFYEQKGPDFGYNLGTHQSNLRMALHYVGGTELGGLLIEEERRFIEWISYNAVPEPDGLGFTLNRAIETRQRAPYLSRLDLDRRAAPPAEVPLAAAFLPTREEMAAARAARRDELARDWPRVRAFEPGNGAFSPYTFLHRRHTQWLPSAAERTAAVATLPYLKSDRFVHQRVDGREALHFTYVRRPRYYAAFNSGRRLMEQQRYGLGLLWTPATGALLQSQTGSSSAAWGTRPDGALHVDEAGDLNAEMRVGGATVAPAPGARDLADGPLTVQYALRRGGTKTVSFGETEIAVSIERAGPFEEQLPLLLADDDELASRDGRVTLLHRGRPVLVVSYEGATGLRVDRTGDRIGHKQVAVVTLPAADRLRYRLELAALE
jgi:hypothetical protein